MASLVRVPPEFDDGRVRRNDKVRSVEDATVPNQDDLLFDGCAHVSDLGGCSGA